MISAPLDYGLTPAQTLSHTCQSAESDNFQPFWTEFRDTIDTLPRHWHGRIDGPVNPVIIPSLGAKRIVGQVLVPEARPRAVVMATHGYAGIPDDFIDPRFYEPWLARGMAVVRIRVRGYPPSTLDMPDLRSSWILHGIEAPSAWILRGAVGDLVQAYRCVRTHFGSSMPINLHGESFGGGLAVIAAAQLAGLDEHIHRLVLGLPSFGDWKWRGTRYCNGSGGQVNMMLDALRGEDREHLLGTLLLFDAAIHARRVFSPCLCKLAQQDDTVPAPSAAAAFNGLAGVTRLRFVTRFGHFDGGIADARRHAMFERLHPVFFDPDQDMDQFALENRLALDV